MNQKYTLEAARLIQALRDIAVLPSLTSKEDTDAALEWLARSRMNDDLALALGQAVRLAAMED